MPLTSCESLLQPPPMSYDFGEIKGDISLKAVKIVTKWLITLYWNFYLVILNLFQNL